MGTAGDSPGLPRGDLSGWHHHGLGGALGVDAFLVGRSAIADAEGGRAAAGGSGAMTVSTSSVASVPTPRVSTNASGICDFGIDRPEQLGASRRFAFFGKSLNLKSG